MDYLELAKQELATIKAQAPGAERALAYAVVALVEALQKTESVTQKSS